jgi:hypothetical protein
VWVTGSVVAVYSPRLYRSTCGWLLSQHGTADAFKRGCTSRASMPMWVLQMLGQTVAAEHWAMHSRPLRHVSTKT